MKKITSKNQLPKVNEYTNTSFNSDLNLCEAINKTITCEAYLNDDENSINLFLDFKNKIEIRKDWKGNFSVFKRRNQHLIDYHGEKSLLKDLEKPNNFKKLNKKTIEKWIQYYKQRDLILNNEEIEIVKKRGEFMAKIDKLVKNGAKLSLHHDNNSGYLDTDLFELKFEFHKNGYISQSIKLRRFEGEAIDKLSELVKK